MRFTPIMVSCSLILGGVAAFPIPAEANTPTKEIERISGKDRYQTSSAVAAATGLDTIEVNESSPDALISSVGAANDDLAAVLSADKEPIGGVNRYDSAAAVALEGDKSVPLVMAYGHSEADILSAASYAVNIDGNLLLSDDDTLSEFAVEAMKEIRPSSLTIIGGTAAISENTVKQAQEITGLKAKRISGKNRYDTALAVAKAVNADSYLLVNGRNPVDAYTLAPLAKQRHAAVVLTQTTCTPKNISSYIGNKEYTIIGGKGAISDDFMKKTCEQETAEKNEAARQAAQIEAAHRAIAQNPYGANTPRGIAYDMLAQYGWGADQMEPLNRVWTYESKWNPRAGRVNGPYGIPQANPGTKMASAGADWATNPATQIRWGLSYIKGRYGSPAAAWAHIRSKGWY